MMFSTETESQKRVSELLLRDGLLLLLPQNLPYLIRKQYGTTSTSVLDAVVLQRIHFEVTMRGVHKKYHLWTQQDIKKWNQDVFRFHRTKYLEESLYRLEKHNLIIVDRKAQIGLYRVNYKTLEQLAVQRQGKAKIIFKPRIKTHKENSKVLI